jgi:DDE superfamily endonuclease
VLGLLAELPRKNCWTIAEHAGDRTPDGMQHLLSRARWDADGVRDDVRSYVVEELGDPGAVLVVDETGDVKKGRATPGLHPGDPHPHRGPAPPPGLMPTADANGPACVTDPLPRSNSARNLA